MALGSTQPLLKMSTRNIPGGKGGRCVRLSTSSPLRAECHEIWEPKLPGTLWATPGLLRDFFTFTGNCVCGCDKYVYKCNVYTVCHQTQLSTRWYANLLNVNINNYMFRPQSLAIIRLYKRKLIN